MHFYCLKSILESSSLLLSINECELQPELDVTANILVKICGNK